MTSGACTCWRAIVLSRSAAASSPGGRVSIRHALRPRRRVRTAPEGKEAARTAEPRNGSVARRAGPRRDARASYGPQSSKPERPERTPTARARSQAFQMAGDRALALHALRQAAHFTSGHRLWDDAQTEILLSTDARSQVEDERGTTVLEEASEIPHRRQRGLRRTHIPTKRFNARPPRRRLRPQRASARARARRAPLTGKGACPHGVITPPRARRARARIPGRAGCVRDGPEPGAHRARGARDVQPRAREDPGDGLRRGCRRPRAKQRLAHKWASRRRHRMSQPGRDVYRAT